MASIDSGRVVMGGIAAGVVMNALDLVTNSTIMKDDMVALAQKFGQDPAAMMSFSAAVPWILADFLIGFAVVWNYAAIRPRFGAGPATALFAVVAPFVVVTAVLYGFTSMGLMPMSTFLKGTAASLVTVALGSLAGGWVYREA